MTLPKVSLLAGDAQEPVVDLGGGNLSSPQNEGKAVVIAGLSEVAKSVLFEVSVKFLQAVALEKVDEGDVETAGEGIVRGYRSGVVAVEVGGLEAAEVSGDIGEEFPGKECTIAYSRGVEARF